MAVLRRPIPQMGLALAAGLSLSAAVASPAGAQMLDATVAQGSLAGVRDGKVGAFLGVPYAAPPVGDMRWKPPGPAARWSGVRPARAPGAPCVQSAVNTFGPWTKEYVATPPYSEDCLFLNVWTPAKTSAARLPVLVWIHGGGFTGGSGAVDVQMGARLAERGIVVVAINYRLGVLGFLAHAGLTVESPAHASGNYGLLDQVAALKWVRQNIASFGGDPDRTTIAGQSAGAMSVESLMASPLATGLFRGAIVQSGGFGARNLADRATGETLGADFAKALGAGTIADLRKVPADDLLAAALKQGINPLERRSFGPIVDGLFYPDAKFVGAMTNDVPVMAGMTAAEMEFIQPEFGKVTGEGFARQVSGTYGKHGDLAPRVMALYAGPGSDPNRARANLYQDRGLAAIGGWARRRGDAAGKKPTFVYLWSRSQPGSAAPFGAFHTAEVPYFMGNLDALPGIPFTADDRRISDQAQAYWVNFVKSGDPNGTGLPVWPRFAGKAPAIVDFGDTVRERPLLTPAQQALFEEYFAKGGTSRLF